MSEGSWFAGAKPGDDVIPDNVRPQRGRKDTRRWCKGKEGVEHTLETVVHHTSLRTKPCSTLDWALDKDRWFCHHAIQCTTCGKYLKQWLPRDLCPDWKGER